ncbi:MAG: TRAP transporter large permease [Burkholderiaceae bacterium]|nr:TRAP transporter large permease [Burkholderiaceae bacterium]
MLVSIIGLLALFVCLFLGMPIAWGMLLIGVIGFAVFSTMEAALAMAGQIAFDTALSYSFTVLPLFIVMGNLVTVSGLSKDLYKAAYAFIGHFRGGLAMATIIACGAFSALCGSSMATAAAMTRVAIPSMREYKYDDRLATGSIAAGGTLGILIPPSVILVVYGILTDTDIGKLFAAGFLPGIVGIFLYILAIAIVTWLRPSLGPRGEKTSGRERLIALRGVISITVLFMVIMGGIYGGIFTPTEAAGIGATGTFIMTLYRRGWNTKLYLTVLADAAQTTAMMFALIIGALVFTNFLTVGGLPTALLDLINGLDVSPMGVILIICAIYLVLGCFLETMSMVLLTVPIFYPIVQSLGFDLVWFGIIVVVAAEIGLITPPIGLNIFVIKNIMPAVALRTIIHGVIPFIMVDIVRLALFVLVPWIILVIPNSMG